MKTISIYLALLIVPVCLTAQTVSSQDEKVINDFLKKTLNQEIEVVAPDAVSKVFVGKFYKVNPGFDFPDGSGYCTDYSFNVNAGVIVVNEKLSTDMDLPQLLSIVKKGFLLKDEATAKLFEAALNTLYPVDEDEVAALKHMKKGNQWIFLRDKFFDNRTAVIATVSANGTITKLEVILGYPVV
jgi:hypothetical protein